MQAMCYKFCINERNKVIKVAYQQLGIAGMQLFCAIFHFFVVLYITSNLT